MSEETRFAVLIDAENISPKYIQIIFDEVSSYGVTTYRRIYGDWTSTRNNRWKEVLLDNSITPIQQYSYTEGKNSSDSAMIIDAMDILYTGSVDGFVLVSSDSDFTRLASRLRESGMAVIGMGESKTPNAFITACNTFKYLDILYAAVSEVEENDALPSTERPSCKKGNQPESRNPRRRGRRPLNTHGRRGTSSAEAQETSSSTQKRKPQPSEETLQTTQKISEQADAPETAPSIASTSSAGAFSEQNQNASPQNPYPSASIISRKDWKKNQKQREESASHIPHLVEPETAAEKAAREPSPARERPKPQTTIGAIRRSLRNIVRENSDEENWISLANLGNQLNKRFPDFDVRNYGHQKLVTFIESFHEFEVASRSTSALGSKQLFVRLIEK